MMFRIETVSWLALMLAFVPTATNAFTIPILHAQQQLQRSSIVQRHMGYLDDLTNELRDTSDPNPDVQAESRSATRLDKEQVDRYGVGDWNTYVEFDEFDGGDGQMGVAGDGKKGLEKEWNGAAEMAKSKTMSAKVAWGKSTGYADSLITQGVESTRAQQIENWKNQREVQDARKEHKWMTDEFDQIQSTADEDWRTLSKFGVERNQQFDLDEEFGNVIPDVNKIEAIVELQSRVRRAEVYEFSLKNPFMGFSDFRARFTSDTNTADWSIEPTEGSLNGRGAPTPFVLKYRPQNPGTSTGYLVVETDDEKWTYQLHGQASM